MNDRLRNELQITQGQLAIYIERMATMASNFNPLGRKMARLETEKMELETANNATKQLLQDQ